MVGKENFIKKLQRENAEMKAELAEQKTMPTPPPVERVIVDDYRDKPYTIVYGRTNNWTSETLPLRDGFQKLIDYYSQFDLSTNRNVPREISDTQANSESVNSITVFARKIVRDKRQKKEVSLIRDMPLWLAVDSVVQQGQQVELISKEEFDEWYKEEEIKDLKADRSTREIIRKERIRKQMLEEEIAKVKE